jgi:hypothetical protein
MYANFPKSTQDLWTYQSQKESSQTKKYIFLTKKSFSDTNMQNTSKLVG